MSTRELVRLAVALWVAALIVWGWIAVQLAPCHYHRDVASAVRRLVA